MIKEISACDLRKYEVYLFDDILSNIEKQFFVLLTKQFCKNEVMNLLIMTQKTNKKIIFRKLHVYNAYDTCMTFYEF